MLDGTSKRPSAFGVDVSPRTIAALIVSVATLTTAAALAAGCGGGDPAPNNGELDGGGSGGPRLDGSDDASIVHRSCTPEQNGCLNPTTALRCSVDREGFEQVACPAGTLCNTTGECVGPLCVVGSSLCTDSGRLIATCLDGARYTPNPCPSPDRCVRVQRAPYDKAECKPAQCDPTVTNGRPVCGDLRNPAADQTRNVSACIETPDGYAWSVTVCPTDTTCSPTGASSHAACRTECVPGEMRASSDAMGHVTCGADGKWPATPVPCNPPGENALFAMADPLHPGKILCGDRLCQQGFKGTCDEAGRIRRCSENGRIAEAAESCALGTCQATQTTLYSGLRPGECKSACKPTEEKCVASGSALFQTCVSGSWGPPQACGDDAGVTCQGYTDGAGLQRRVCGECRPGEHRCAATDGGSNDALQTCDATGHWGATTACSVGACTYASSDYACVVQCIPGRKVCGGATSSGPFGTEYAAEGFCSPTGRLPTAFATCALESRCRITSTGNATGCMACIGPNVPGRNELGVADSRCNGADAEICRNDNTWGTVLQTCVSAGQCVAPSTQTCLSILYTDSYQMSLSPVGTRTCLNQYGYAAGACGSTPDCCGGATGPYCRTNVSATYARCL